MVATDTVSSAYAKLEERVLARDQVGASRVFYEVVKDGRPPLRCLRRWCTPPLAPHTDGAASKHTAGHRKYGDPLEAYQRFADAMDIAR